MRGIKILVGMGVAVATVIIDGLVWWNVLAPTLAALRARGPFGQFTASLLASHFVMLALALSGTIFAIRAFYERTQPAPAYADRIPPIHIENKPHFEFNSNLAEAVTGRKSSEHPKPGPPEAIPNIIFLGSKTLRIRSGVD